LFFFSFLLFRKSCNCSHAFLTFPDDASAAAAVKQGATFQNKQLKIAFQTKRPEPQKRSVDSADKSGSFFFFLKKNFHSKNLSSSRSKSKKTQR
jgi:hypothetical protein